MTSWGRWLLGLALAVPAPAGRGYVGSQVCAGCHGGIAALHAESAHRRALAPAAEHQAASELVRLGNVFAPPGIAIRFYRAGMRLRVRLADAREETDMVVDWAFGAGGQGVTLVSRLDERHYLEHGHSYFGAARLARTPGHVSIPRNLDEAVGLVYPVEGADGIRACFECHSTGGVSFSTDGEASLGEAGVGCEACHGPGEGHLGEPKTIAAGRASPSQQLELCGGCHRQPRDAEKVDWDDPWNVRHAPVYLARSQCFQRGALGCTSCHDPHARLAKAEGRHYRAVCVQCHPNAHAGRSAFADCVGCHMPSVQPHERLRFTNHWIGIYADAAPLQPIRH